MSFRRKIAYNTIAQLSGRIITTLFSVILTILLTRYLGVVGYGQYNIAITFIGLFVVLADLGIYPISVREISQNPEESKKIIGNVFTYRLFSAFFVILLGFLISFLTSYDLLVKLAIGIVGISSFFSLLTGSLMAIFQVNYRMDLPAFIEVFSRGLFLALVYFGIRAQYGLLKIFWLMNLTGFLNLLIVYLTSRSFLKFRPQFDLKFCQGFLRESLPMGIVTILSLAHFKIDTILLSLYKPTYDVGIYGVAYRVFENLIVIPSIFVGLLFPRLSELITQDKKILIDFLQKAVNVLSLAAVPTIVTFLFLAPLCIQVIAGSDFIAASFPLRILSLGLLWVFLGAPFSLVVVAAKKQKYLIFAWLGLLAVNLILNLIVIPLYSYKGASFVTFTSELFVFALLYSLMVWLLKLRVSFSFLKRTLLPALIATFFFYYFLKLIPLFNLPRFSELILIFQLLLVVGAGLLYFCLYGGLYYLLERIRKSPEEITQFK